MNATQVKKSFPFVLYLTLLAFQVECVVLPEEGGSFYIRGLDSNSFSFFFSTLLTGFLFRSVQEIWNCQLVPTIPRNCEARSHLAKVPFRFTEDCD